MNNILKEIVEKKKKTVEILKEKKPIAEKDIKGLYANGKFFKNSLLENEINIIAEIKKASPSKGVFKNGFNPFFLLKEYESGGAKGISVLTEENYFLGSSDIFIQIRKKTKLPLLRKDFIIDEYQIYESLLLGADSVLLIASLLEKEKLKDFISISESLGFLPIVEVHNKGELEKSLKCNAKAIGVNARDLKTFKVDINIVAELIKDIPDGIVRIAESGIKNKEDIVFLKNAGANAFLVGETLVKNRAPAVLLKSWRAV